jgi:hypothetical protein
LFFSPRSRSACRPGIAARVSTLILFHHAAEYKLASVTPHRRQKVT